jgi:hypothetical protein
MTFYNAYRNGMAMDLSDMERPPSRHLFRLPWKKTTAENGASETAEAPDEASSPSDADA